MGQILISWITAVLVAAWPIRDLLEMEPHRDQLFKSGAVWCVLTVPTDGVQIRKVHELRLLRSVYFTTLLEDVAPCVWRPGFTTRNWHMQHMHQLHLGEFLMCFMSCSFHVGHSNHLSWSFEAEITFCLKIVKFTVYWGFLPFWTTSRCRESRVESLLWTFQQGHVLYRWQCISVI